MRKLTVNKIGMRIIASAIAVSTLLTTALVFGAQTDTKQEDIFLHWAASSISFVQEKQLYLGVDNNNFLPEIPMTRELLVTAVARLDNSNTKGTNNFVDVNSNSIYAPYIGWAARNGIVVGVGNQQFDPTSSITREQLALIFLNYLNYKGIPLPTQSDNGTFLDHQKISSWAARAVYQIKEMGIISGRPNNIFDPKGLATRAEVASMLDRLYHSYINPNPSIPGAYSEERNVTNEDRQVFKEATQKMVGVNYEPVKVATQVVAGTNYKFYVKATPVVPNATSYYTYMYIFKPLSGSATVTSIDDVNIPEENKPGGYSEERDLTAKDLDVFKKATQNITGVTYEPLKVSTQVVNGTNYKFYVNVKMVIPDGRPSVGYVFIYEPINGEPTVTNIERPEY